MHLTKLDYSEFEGKEQEWSIEGLTLGKRNLLVGKNATGKSRVLNVIAGLANLLLGERLRTLVTGTYKAVFEDAGKSIEYAVRIEDRQVMSESLQVDGRTLLERGNLGEGKIFYEKFDTGGRIMEFQTPPSELAAFVRRDTKQHSFLEPLHHWSASVRHYQFGTPLGRESLALLVKQKGKIPDGKDAGEIVGVFNRAKRDFPGLFLKNLLADLKRMDYPLTEIQVGPPLTIQFDTVLSSELVGFRVREEGLKGITDQLAMSQGMFRVFSLLILTNYLDCTQLPACLLVDDIGEGLDFERSCRLIDILREKAQKSGIQLIASTNDRHVMNQVPLDEWAVLRRTGSMVEVKNYENSRKHFDSFRFMGLNNFDFLRYDFINENPDAVLEEAGVGKD
jgi:energy-coupling factor transporter ATP-binding protein EcfA2